VNDPTGRLTVVLGVLSILAALCLPSHLLAACDPVLAGIDVLEQRGFDVLLGKQVGLITNHTGRSRDGRSTIDIINRAPGVRLTALFSPEHGIRGEADEKVSSATDLASGLPVHSLYGATCRPTPDMLQGVDILVFDIQDVGTRFYTYIGTLSLAMRAAREANIPFVVLDRPNPLGGERVGGAIPAMIPPERADSCGAIASIHPIPTRHGMTIGELALLFNSEFGIGCRLTVVPMQGWRRDMYFDDTGLAWVNPSPNMKSLSAAILYPGLGALESANLSVGRGTEFPFLAYGAPWADGAAVARNLAGRGIPGITFTPCSFVPTAAGHPYSGKQCFGVCVASLERDRLDPILAGLHLAQAFYETHPRQFRLYEGFGTEVGDREAWGLLRQEGVTPLDVARRWDHELERFRQVRSRYLLY
jgi:uncharacterized protein YbbC (DUF1343 family)